MSQRTYTCRYCQVITADKNKLYEHIRNSSCGDIHYKRDEVAPRAPRREIKRRVAQKTKKTKVLTQHEQNAVRGYQLYHGCEVPSLGRVKSSSASIEGWNKYFLEQNEIFTTPPSSPR